jgi:hypothetical protein
MKITHSAITSSIYELIKVIEVDIELGEDAWTARIELFQDTERKDFFRCNVWERELFRLIPSFPRDENNEPAHFTDDAILVKRPIAHSKLDYKGFVAPDQDTALKMIIDDLKYFLEYVTGEKAV